MLPWEFSFFPRCVVPSSRLPNAELPLDHGLQLAGRLLVAFQHAGQNPLLVGDLEDQRFGRGRFAFTPAAVVAGQDGEFHRIAFDEAQRRHVERSLAFDVALRRLVRGPLVDLDFAGLRLAENFRRPSDSLFFTGGRGCPGACTFCARLHGQSVRVKPAEQLLAEIEQADALVADGRLPVTEWELFKHTDDPVLKTRRVAWAAVYDEDFFLDRRRAIGFFSLWDRSPLRDRYRLSVQTNPCSLLTSDGRPHAELLAWIDRLKPMIQLGAEAFHDVLLTRWHKRHNVAQLIAVLDALDSTHQDYTVFQLLTDYETTPEEFVETLRCLIVTAYKHRRMRIASTAYTIPLYDSEIRKMLEYSGRLDRVPARHFTDYERPQPGWMNPLVADLADLADAELHWTLVPEQRDAALYSAMTVVAERIAAMAKEGRNAAMIELLAQVHTAVEQIQEVRFGR